MMHYGIRLFSSNEFKRGTKTKFQLMSGNLLKNMKKNATTFLTQYYSNNFLFPNWNFLNFR